MMMAGWVMIMRMHVPQHVWMEWVPLAAGGPNGVDFLSTAGPSWLRIPQAVDDG
jgi:alpha-D-ribose 1-methylphosphonate 5-triphosphate synthase subunit PhnH